MGSTFEFTLNGLRLQTGDLICTSDGSDENIRGQFWRLLGKIIPGDVDHIIVYIGPDGRCVEAGAKGRVITFDIQGVTWDYKTMFHQRGIVDELYGVAYPLAGRSLPEDAARVVRQRVAEYCLRQAELRKPYNLNFLDSSTDKAFYCSQLAYKAYLPCGIDMNTGKGIPNIAGTESIIFPQELWSGCVGRRCQ